MSDSGLPACPTLDRSVSSACQSTWPDSASSALRRGPTRPRGPSPSHWSATSAAAATTIQTIRAVRYDDNLAKQ